MRLKYVLLYTIPVILLTALIPSTVLAEAIVKNVPGNYSSIQTALTEVEKLILADPTNANTYSILVEPNSTHYTVPAGGIVLKTNIPIRGRETARTIIDGGGGTAVTAADVTGVSFKNFTIVNASTGVSVTGNSSVTIANNVFVGATITAVMIQSLGLSGSSSVINNTFYQNATAISRDTDSFAITNNIFYNTTNTFPQIVQIGISTENTITYNLFYPDVIGPKGTGFIPNINITNSNPSFVDPAKNDFHIASNPTSTSPCIDHGDPSITDSIDGTPSDIGAYGGPYADTIPFPVPGVAAAAVQGAADSIKVSWSPNTNISYVINDINPNDHTTTGGYNLYYSLNARVAPYQIQLSLASTETNTVISGLTTTATQPAAPVLNALGFDNNTLLVSWPSVSGATGYIVYYALATGASNTQASPVIPDIPYNIISYTIPGLENGTTYNVWATAVTQPVYYLAVTAFDYTPGTHNPGVEHESEYASSDLPVYLGSPVESLPSNTVTGFPEAFLYTPNLPNKGCFIATAAYGYYDAPQVQALRDFRDRYLETNSAGRAFVSWYYEYGPIGAAALNNHPWLKPMVRTALMPAVGGALFLTKTSTSTQLLVLFLFSLMLAALVLYKNVRRGGSR